jgi:nucleoside-diphosphate-sugar epimerase
MKNLLIIGGSKFIGKAFVDYFSFQNKLNNLIITIISKKKIYIPKKNKKIIIIKKNFNNIKELPECDFILYCLRATSIQNDNKLFILFKEKIFKLKKKPKIIFTSSGSVYGVNNKKIKIKESKKIKTHNVDKMEKYKKKWSKQKSNMEKKFYLLSKKKYKILILRMFSFIGKNLIPEDYAPSEFIKSSMKNKSIKINGPINTYRSYLHEKDLVEWIVKIFYKFNKDFDVYNFGSDIGITVHNLSKMIRNHFNQKKITLLNNSKKTDYFVPSIEKLKKSFKLKINISLNNAILKTIKK